MYVRNVPMQTNTMMRLSEAFVFKYINKISHIYGKKGSAIAKKSKNKLLYLPNLETQFSIITLMLQNQNIFFNWEVEIKSNCLAHIGQFAVRLSILRYI